MAPTLNQSDGGGNDAATDARIKQQMVPQTKKTFEKFYEIKKSMKSKVQKNRTKSSPEKRVKKQ